MKDLIEGNAADLPQTHDMVCLYFSRPGCGVCDALRPRVEELLQHYPGVESWFVDLEQHPEAAGHYSVFTIPAVILFVQGKETVRFARYFSIDQLEEKISRYYELLGPLVRTGPN
jgi:thioredoxin-like negative regulator of GroEL